MIRTKDSSINITNLHPNLKIWLDEMSNKFDGIVVTSGNDAIHLVGSRHYLNKAIDIGANSSNPNAYAAFEQYVLEGRSTWHNSEKFAAYQIEDIIDEGNHIHIELPLTVQEAKIVKLKQGSFIAVIVLLIGISIYLKWIKKHTKN